MDALQIESVLLENVAHLYTLDALLFYLLTIMLSSQKVPVA